MQHDQCFFHASRNSQFRTSPKSCQGIKFRLLRECPQVNKLPYPFCDPALDEPLSDPDPQGYPPGRPLPVFNSASLAAPCGSLAQLRTPLSLGVGERISRSRRTVSCRGDVIFCPQASTMLASNRRCSPLLHTHGGSRKSEN